MKDDIIRRRQASRARHTATTTGLIDDGRRYLVEGQDAPSLHLFSIRSGLNYSDPLFRPLTGDLVDSVSELALDVLDQGVEFIRCVCDLDTPHDLPRFPARKGPTALCAIGCLGIEVGQPRTAEALHVNGLAIVPRSLRPLFQEFVSGALWTPTFEAGPTPVLDVNVYEIENSDLSVTLAVDHVLRFSRTYSAALLPEEVSALCIINGPPAEASNPMAGPT